MTEETAMPWRNYPKKIIQYASEFENTKDDFERFIGYLLLDVGVESLLKAFVLADTSLNHSEREASAKGMLGKDAIPESKITAVNFEKITFHNLLETVKRAAKSKVTDEELRNVEHYHGIRNTIYHEGRKTIPSEQDFRNYLSLAKSFLQRLLNVSEDSRIILRGKDGNVLDGDGLLDYQMELLRQSDTFHDFQRDVAVAIALLRPNYATRSFEGILKKLGMEVDALSSIPYNSSSYEIVENKLTERFTKITGHKIRDIKFMLESSFDVTYLHLAVLLSILQEDVSNGLETYVKFREFSQRRPPSNLNEITQDDIDTIDNLSDWVYRTLNKINSWTEKKASEI